MKTLHHPAILPARLLLTGLFLLIFAGASAQGIDFGKSYINVSKGLNGGTVETGDILEIRAAFVVRSGTYDSCGYFDVVPAGTTYIPGTVRVLTNEGKIYKQFTDALTDDEGWRTGTTIRINLGFNPLQAPARFNRRGRVGNTYRPSFYNSSCIMIASFRVQVTGPVGTVISTGGGSMTYKLGTAAIQTYTFPANRVAVYTNYGICSNLVGTNALGTEFNGTFGAGRPRNRGASANVPPSYTYNTFTSNSPQDYYYGIPNNTSINTGYTTTNAWAKPDNLRRVFGVWDIIGDHTGAASPTAGNPAADTVANPNAGYMLVINASYRIDSAFQQTISNLCPNTYYEISCWMRNICSRCGCDSAGRGAGTAGYIPTATGDSSGVYPNLTFEVDGIDYYTTGNILYTGSWVKKGFTFLTGPSQTSFTLKFFNNAPGGGGNDWALDDISVATCSPNLSFTPDNNPNICRGNVAELGCWIRSYFNNYTEYKWQRSNDNGLTWGDIGPAASATPTWNGSAWQYYTSLPPFVTNPSDSGAKFRVVAATTASNLTNSSCAFSEAASVLTLNVIDCGDILSANLLSFRGEIEQGSSVLQWNTGREEGPVTFIIEKSTDGRSFHTAGKVNGRNNPGAEKNAYKWSEPFGNNGALYYRIRLSGSGGEKLSSVVRLSTLAGQLTFVTVPNPFSNKLTADILTPATGMIEAELVDNLGAVIRRQQAAAGSGSTKISMETGSVPAGVYTLRVKSGSGFISRRVVKN